MSRIFETLISADDLQALLHSDTAPVLLDCSFDLADTAAGRRAYDAGHVPGSRYLNLGDDLSSAPTGANGRHPLPTRDEFAQRVGEWGIAPGVQVVCLDAQGMPYAARAWWMLRWLGHQAVAVLDGGVQAWLAAGRGLTTDAPAAQPKPPYPSRPPAMATVNADALLAQLGRRPILDARAPERFRGDVETLDSVGGHIPGAANRFFKNNLREDGRFKPADSLRAEFLALGSQADQWIHQCGSGVTACHNLLAMEHAGLSGSALYPGSWSEWCADATRPVAKG
ncbi:MAG: sulfurtransferase [Rubrivivax sp.]